VFVFSARPPTDHPVDVGLRSELALTNAYVQLGYAVFLPVGHNHRCDLVVEHGDRLLRVQCKTGRLRGGVIRFSTQSVRCNSRDAIRRSYAGEVDGFAVWCPQNATGYYVPIEDVASGIATLRVAPTATTRSAECAGRPATGWEVERADVPEL
jgi:hypothetical protein